MRPGPSLSAVEGRRGLEAWGDGIAGEKEDGTGVCPLKDGRRRRNKSGVNSSAMVSKQL